MEHSNYERTLGTFGGEQRSYTRHVWYRADDADFNSDMHGDQLVAPTQRLADLDEDPYAEGGLSDVHEDPETIAQFRNDVRGERFASIVKQNWAVGQDRYRRETAAQLATRQAQTRAEVLRAVEQARSQQSLFDLDPIRCVPAAYREDFLATPEMEDVCAALVPMTLTQAIDPVHLTEWQLRRVMGQTGCEFVSAETRLLPGRLRDHLPGQAPGTDAEWHAHYDETTCTTPLRLLVYKMPPDNYNIRLVSHLVADADNDHDRVVCFRNWAVVASRAVVPAS